MWHTIPAAAAAALLAAKQQADVVIATAEATTLAAAGTPGLPAAEAAQQLVKTQEGAAMAAAINAAAGGADKHICGTPLPVPPHGVVVIVHASTTVLVDNLPVARMGDKVIEALGPPYPIAEGYPTVIVG